MRVRTTSASLALLLTACGGEAIIDGPVGGSSDELGRIRVAHLSPDAPAVDVCVDGGDGFIGPVLGAGLSYPDVTDYLELPASTYTVRIVAPGGDCSVGLVPDTPGVTLPAGVDATVAATGMLAPTGGDASFALQVYVDDNATPPPGIARLRFVHASPDAPAVDVGTGSNASGDFSVIWDAVNFPDVGQVAGDDYLGTPALEGATVTAQAAGSGTDALVVEGVSLPTGAVATAFAIGNLDGAPQPLRVLLCVDNRNTVACDTVP